VDGIIAYSSRLIRIISLLKFIASETRRVLFWWNSGFQYIHTHHLRQSYHAPTAEMTASPSSHDPKIDAQLERSLLGIEIPPCPEILIRIMAEMHKEEPDYHRLTDLISADVALSAGLIKTTNSPFFARSQRARSVHDALTILGLRFASHTIAGIILRNLFPNTPNMCASGMLRRAPHGFVPGWPINWISRVSMPTMPIPSACFTTAAFRF
jgi:hypothetical protein